MTEPGDKGKTEFLSEAQELIDAYSRNIINIERAHNEGSSDPDLLNEAFRNIHTLKGLAGLFGQYAMSDVSHKLEDLLDRLRLGRVSVSAELLDLLYGAVDVYWQLLGPQTSDQAELVTQYLARIAQQTQDGGGTRPAREAPQARETLGEYELDRELLAVLTEYEEHRLQVGIREGRRLLMVRVRFGLEHLDAELSAIKERVKPLGEVVTYLPTGSNADPEALELDLLVAAKEDLAQVRAALGESARNVEELPRKQAGASKGSLAKRPEPAPPPARTTAAAQSSERERPSQPHTGGRAEPHHQSVAPGGAMRSLSQTVRVDIRKLDELMTVLGKLAVLKSNLGELSERARGRGDRQLSRQLLHLGNQFHRSLRELQGGLLDVRMVPLTQVFERLTRIVRQTGRDLGKDVRLVVTGADTEIDKLIVEELSDPLMHIVRNSVDHGIEAAPDREAKGKPLTGTIALNAFQKGNHVVIEAQDDGRGVDTELLLQKAVSLGLLAAPEAQETSREEALKLIFHPGLSTRREVSAVSGRGVGMDVVKTNISRLGGSIDVESETNRGTKITITLPLTRAIVTALLVQVATNTFAIPLNSITQVTWLDPRHIRLIDNAEVLNRRGQSLELRRLRRLFGYAEGNRGAREYVVEVTAGARRLGLVVEALQGQQDIIIRPLGRSLHSVKGFSGAAELGDERIALVLDPGALIDEAGKEVAPGRLLHSTSSLKAPSASSPT